MTDFRERYKRLGFDPDANRALRSHRRDEARRGIRDEQMSLRREMGDVQNADDDSFLEEETTASTQPSVSASGFSQDGTSVGSSESQEAHKSKAEAEYEAAVQQRWERLQKWREEKKKRQQIEKKKAKPVFKVGVVHHRIYSPPVTKEAAPMPPPKLCKSRDMSANLSQTAQPKRVTRATEKRLAIKTIVNQQKRENTRSKKKAQAQIHNPTDEDKQVEIAPKDHMFKAPIGVTPMPIFGRSALEATKANIQAEIDSFHISSIPINPSFSESFNESSMSLKMSSDDQETMDDSVTKEAKSPVTRRSSKNHSPPAADNAEIKGVIPNDQEMMDVEQVSKTEKRNSGFVEKTESPVRKGKSPKVATPKDVNTSMVQAKETPSRKRKSIAPEPKEVAVDSPRPTRSTRAADRRRSVRVASTDSADSGIEPSLTPEESSVKVADSETDSVSTPGKEEKLSTSRHRSSKILEDEIVKSVATPPKRGRPPKLISSDKEDDDTFAKPAASRRRSTRIIPSEKDNLNSSSIVTIADVHHSPLASQEPNIPIKSPPRKKSTRFTTHDQENLDFNNTNLMDFTFSAPAKPPKLLDPPKTLLDDTVSNLSPRRSSRLPTGPTVVNSEEDQPLIRFSSFYVPPPTGNESSSSEPMKQRSPNEIMNLSLNMSLPKDADDEEDVEKPPPAYFSPYIVQSRGKNSARKEMKKRRFSQPGLEGEDIPTKDNIMQKLNISVDEEARTAQYYKHILGNEIERLNELCERWNTIKEDPSTPEDNRYIIQAAVGQTQLLINKKFERFRRLVEDCETGRGEMLVTCKDLQGFWEMMYMEINDCDGRFNKLEEMKANNWVEKEDEAAVKEVEKKKKKAPVKKPVAKKAAAGNKPSSLRAMILAARKKKAEADGGVEGGEGAATESTEKLVEQTNDTEKPATPTKANLRRSSTPKSGNKWDNLLKKVQLSQTRKSTTSPLVVMKLGQMVKTPEVQLDDSIVYINSARTPAKSILKKDEVMGSVSKSTNKVFFREQSNEVKEFEIRNSFVDDNMSLDNIEELKEPIERRLDFEDESFVENAEEKGQSAETTSSASQFVSNLSAGSPKNSKVVTLTTSPMISMSPLSLEDKKSPRSVTKGKPAKLKKQISFKEVGEESEPNCSRTKKFSAPLTPRPKRREQEDIDEDMIVEVDDTTPEDTPGPKMVKEIYLNEHGVVCERLVPVKKDTPARSKLKRSNSEATQRGRKSNKTLESQELKKTPSTPRLTRRNTHVPEIHVTTPNTTTKQITGKKQSLKRSFADTTLTQDSVDISMEETTTPKQSKRTPKTTKTKSEAAVSPVQSPKPTLKRTRSLKVATVELNDVKKTATPKLRRTKSLTVKDVHAEDSPKKALKRKSLKKLQENIEPDEQETGKSTKEKLHRTPSFKRKSTKQQFENIEQSEKLTDVGDVLSDTMTPNTRRKSLRITRASVKDGIQKC